MTKSVEERKAEILDAGARLAAKHGVKNVTRESVAKAIGVTAPLVSHYVGGTAKAQAAYKRHATKLGLKLPDKAAEAELGLALRRKGKAAAPVKKAAAKRPVKKVAVAKSKAKPAPAVKPKSKAARKPLAPPPGVSATA